MTTATKPPKLTYDTRTCGRCGGSGTYSYCQRFGTTCFGCSGKKITLTKAGAAAAAAVKQFMADHFSVRAGDVQPGDRVKIDGQTRTVATVAPGLPSQTKSGDGPWVSHPTVSLSFTKPVKSAYGAFSDYNVPAAALLQTAVSGANWDAVVAFAWTLDGVTVVGRSDPAAQHQLAMAARTL